ncbi:hypothetical protein AYK24_04470 [Thermoplasmatales archaeon SG8-52-4]|nr:MAG: hypothetical protein AYK24_04470 [Thermoplasmatales archaeon SG8-52-4]
MIFLNSSQDLSDKKSELNKDYDTSKSSFNFKYIFETYGEKRISFPNNIIIETINDINNLKNFYNMAFNIYKNDKFWIPPFWIEFKYFFNKKNPFWKHSECRLFIVKKDNKIVGRIAGLIDHRFIEKINKKIGYFGFFECIDDYNCAEALLKTVQDWLISKKIEIMRGPINGRVDLGCGFLKNGFNSYPTLLSSYSPLYYISFAEKFNMTKVREQFCYYIDLTKPFPKKLEKKAQECADSGIKIRKFSRFFTKKDMDMWVDLFLETFEGHWGYVPVKPEEVKTRFGIKQMRYINVPSLFLIAEYNDSPVAYIWALPEYNQIFKSMNGRFGLYQILQFLLKKRQINIGRMPLIGIKKEFRNKNIGSYLNYLIMVEMKKKGYIGADVGWIDEKNTVAHTTIAITGAKLYKKFCVFDKDLYNSKKVL